MMAPGGPRLVLASGSPTRRALLAAAGLEFDVRVPGVEESVIKSAMRAEGESAAAAALALADAKAAAIPAPGAVVVGADQILLCDGEWFDKPADLAAARGQLVRLRGREHRLVTAVTCWRDGRKDWSAVTSPVMRVRAVSDAFLDRYIEDEGAALLGSVGAYRVEGLGMHLFDGIEGEFTAVLGLPMLELLAYLRRCGVALA